MLQCFHTENDANEFDGFWLNGSQAKSHRARRLRVRKRSDIQIKPDISEGQIKSRIKSDIFVESRIFLKPTILLIIKI